MNCRKIVAATLFSATTLTGCASDPMAGIPGADFDVDMDGPLKGSEWVGQAAGWELKIKINRDWSFDGDRSLTGVLTTNRSDCFAAADIHLKPTDSVVDTISHSHGSLADSSFVKIKGKMSDDTIEGRFTVSASSDESDSTVDVGEACEITNEPIVLKKQ